ncbi:MAG: hypothetical protein FWC64_04750 [Treponema sp.]|nr:hypothetical protein [Treponema sp.]
MGLNMKERKPLLREAAKRYQRARTKKEKPMILDEAIAYTGINRKYLIHILANAGKTAVTRMGKGYDTIQNLRHQAAIVYCGQKKRN